ncbi:MAG: histidine phosphatase family protein [Egibacteraceae bacterium]
MTDEHPADEHPALPRTDRPDAPLYLARYRARQGNARENGSRPGPEPRDDGTGTPLYLRRFRERREAGGLIDAPPPLIRDGASTWTPAFAEVTKDKELSPPPQRREQDAVTAQIHIIRHGITQGYSTDSGLTPLGGWQSHRRGHDLSKGVKDGERIRIVCAGTNRARQTAEQIKRGLLDGLALWGREAEVTGPDPMEEFGNFAVWTPDGPRDPTSAFRQYHALMERYERVAMGDRPLWLVEIDRFWTTQQGGADPIHLWMTVPLLHFEPPQACVRRFWRGFHRLIGESPGFRILCATHSGPMRAFATWAHGYDPGEPYNTEEVVVKVRRSGREALVAYRNRVTEVHVPPLDQLPTWELGEQKPKGEPHG